MMFVFNDNSLLLDQNTNKFLEYTRIKFQIYQQPTNDVRLSNDMRLRHKNRYNLGIFCNDMLMYDVRLSIDTHRGGARIFCLGGPNFVTNILVSSQEKPSHSGINAHTQI